MLTKGDIDWMKSELVPALSEQVKKDISVRLDWIVTMLDKQSGNLQSIEKELTLIRASLDTNDENQSSVEKRVENLEKHAKLLPLAS
ncbi:MAG: hypothetical protein ABID64_00940 [Nitrospirota bacterium]